MKILVVLALSVVAQGACLPVRGGRITAADVAAAVPLFTQLPPDSELIFAQMPGTTRVFTAAELNGRLSRNGIDGSVTEPVCFAWPMSTLNEDELRTSMLSVLPPDSELTIDAANLTAPPGPIVLPIGGLRNGMWRGYVEYEPRRRFPVSVRVDVRAPFSRVIATEAIRVGERIAESKLRVETGVAEPSVRDDASSTSEVAGRVARRLIRAGSAVERSALGEARVIARGDAVHVDVISGGARLRFQGVAEGTAGVGDLAAVRNPDTGKLVHVRIDETGRARLLLATEPRP
jgi:flagella basal body P-ring formation protein FlgA